MDSSIRKPSSKKRRPKPPIPFKRVNAEIQIEQSKQVVRGRLFLNDLTATDMSLFVEHQIELGSKVSVVIEKPRHLFLKGTITWCTLANMNPHIISPDNFQYRAGVNFQFDSKEQAEEFKKYYFSLYQSAKN